MRRVINSNAQKATVNILGEKRETSEAIITKMFIGSIKDINNSRVLVNQIREIR